MILLQTDAPENALSASVRTAALLFPGDSGAARKPGPSLRRGWSEVKLSDCWSLATVEEIRAELAADGYRVYITVRADPL